MGQHQLDGSGLCERFRQRHRPKQRPRTVVAEAGCSIPSIGEPGTAQYCSIDAHGSMLLVTIREDVANAATALYEQSTNAGVSWSQVRAPAVASKPGQATPLC